MSLGSLAAYVAILAVFAAGGFYLYIKTQGDTSRLFTPRTRRLAFIERAHLDNGRRLLLVRRDDVEHLILIGGPIDLVVENGIRAESLAGSEVEEDYFAGAVRSIPAAASASQRPDALAPAAKAAAPAEPRLSLSPDAKENKEDTLDLTKLQEEKAAVP
ncbi:MAG: hypothetical protein ACLPWS_21465 [Rhodomicrobium sp.]